MQVARLTEKVTVSCKVSTVDMCLLTYEIYMVYIES